MQTIMNGVGVGLRHQHFNDFQNSPPKLDWIEVHPENFLTLGVDFEQLQELSKNYKLSLHGVGLSLGSKWDEESSKHLKRIQNLIEHLRCDAFSEHISWSKHGGKHLHDLLPITYNDYNLNLVADNIKRVQDMLGMQIAVENPSIYMQMENKYSEADFINMLIERAECRLLLDVNNVEVSAFNLKYDMMQYLSEIDISTVQELHIAGHTTREDPDNPKIKIDTHSTFATNNAWNALEWVVSNPEFNGFAIYEWDSELPEFSILLEQSDKIKEIFERNVRLSA